MSIRNDIMSRMAFLPRSTQRIGRMVVREPGAVVELRVAELASLCDTDEASVLRFCRAVGFGGYGELREALQHEADELQHHNETLPQVS